MWLKPKRPAGEWPIALIANSAFGLVRSQAENMPRWQNQHSPAADGEGNHDAVANLEVGHLRAELDHLAHILVAEDVAALHRGLIAVEQMQVGAANRAGRDLDHGVAGVLDPWVGNGIDADIALSVPAKCAHRSIS